MGALLAMISAWYLGGMAVIDAERLERIALADPEHADTLRAHPSEVEVSKPELWPGVEVLKIAVMLPHRPILLRYADDGRKVWRLAKIADVEALSAERGLVLDQAGASRYARLCLELGGHRVLERPEEVNWLASAEGLAEAKRALETELRPIEARATPRGFLASVSALAQRDLVRLEVEVDRAGRILGIESRTVFTALPVPYVQ